MRWPIGPERATNGPCRAEACIVCDSILDDQRFNAIRMSHRHPETDRPAIVLHEQAVSLQGQYLREPADYFSQVIESIGECVRCRRSTVAETGVVRCDQPVAIGKSGEQRL